MNAFKNRSRQPVFCYFILFYCKMGDRL